MKKLIKILILIIVLLPVTSCKKEDKLDNSFDLAIMIQDDKGEYEKWVEKTWPDSDDYVFNAKESTCDNGSEIKWDNDTNTINLKAKGQESCHVVFDKKIKIEHIEDLVDLAIRVNNGDSLAGKTIVLTRDLDFQNSHGNDYKNKDNKEYNDFNKDNINGKTIYEELTSEEGAGFLPIGDESHPFEGNFDGNNYTLSNFYINSTTDYPKGLFSMINQSEIKNLNLSGIMKVTMIDSGSLVGSAISSKIENVKTNVDISSTIGSNSLGGIMGFSKNCVIKNSANYGNILNSNNAGGLVGIVGAGSQLIIENSHNDGNVTNNLGGYAGGLIGRDNSADAVIMIKNSYNIGNVTMSNVTRTLNLGGIIGMNLGTIEIDNCHNSGNIINPNTESQTVNIGGFIGKNQGGTNIIKNSYNNGEVKNGSRIGGMVGFIESPALALIDKSYNIGSINSNIVQSLGGLVGYGNGVSKVIILNSYNAGTLTGNKFSSGLYGRSNGNMSDETLKSTSIVLNSYNIGDVIGTHYSTSGLLITELYANSVLNNVYNIGNFSDNQRNGLTYYNIVNGTKEINNAYYNIDHVAKGTNLEDMNEKINGLSDAVLKNETKLGDKYFVDILNENIKTIDLEKIDPLLKDYKLCSWQKGENGYPELVYD